MRLDWSLSLFTSKSQKSLLRAFITYQKCELTYSIVSVVLYAVIVLGMIILFLQTFRAIWKREIRLRNLYSLSNKKAGSSSSGRHATELSHERDGNVIFLETKANYSSDKQEQRRFKPSPECKTGSSHPGNILVTRYERRPRSDKCDVFGAGRSNARQKDVFELKPQRETTFGQRNMLDVRIDNGFNSTKDPASDFKKQTAPSTHQNRIFDSKKGMKSNLRQDGLLCSKEELSSGSNREGALHSFDQKISSCIQKTVSGSRKEEKLTANQGLFN